MKMRFLVTALLIVVAGAVFTTQAAPHERDYLTPQEVDLVKEAQELDKRTDVFIKAMERRLIALNGQAETNAKQLKKDAERWGELPTGSKAELIGDIARILDAAIDNIDDVSARDERNPLIPKSLRRLAAALNSLLTQVKPLAAQAKTEAEIASFELLNENAQSIMEAAARLPAEVDKKSKKKN